jgi:hypothetical protein
MGVGSMHPDHRHDAAWKVALLEDGEDVGSGTVGWRTPSFPIGARPLSSVTQFSPLLSLSWNCGVVLTSDQLLARPLSTVALLSPLVSIVFQDGSVRLTLDQLVKLTGLRSLLLGLPRDVGWRWKPRRYIEDQGKADNKPLGDLPRCKSPRCNVASVWLHKGVPY